MKLLMYALVDAESAIEIFETDEGVEIHNFHPTDKDDVGVVQIPRRHCRAAALALLEGGGFSHQVEIR